MSETAIAPRIETSPHPAIPANCRACGRPLLIANLYVCDGCPCNSANGVNFPPRTCPTCGVDDCTRPGHRLSELFGVPPPNTPSKYDLIASAVLLLILTTWAGVHYFGPLVARILRGILAYG